MAMVVCPECGKEISDKAKVCPGCGHVIKAVDEPKHLLECEECGTEYEETLEMCPNCGCPRPKKVEEDSPQKVEVTGIAINKKKLIIAISAAVVAITVIIGGIFATKNITAKKETKEYYKNMSLATATMLSGASQAESTAGLIHDVWRNAIYQERDDKTDKYTRPRGYFVDDFNDALNELWEDSNFNRDVIYIENNQDSVKELMKKLQNPPKEYVEAYDALKEFYNSYLEFTNLAVEPTGSLNSYTESYNELDSETLNNYDKMKMYLEN